MNTLIYATMKEAQIRTLDSMKKSYGVNKKFEYSILKQFYNTRTGQTIGTFECIRSVNVIETWGFCFEDPIEEYSPPAPKRVRFSEDVPSSAGRVVPHESEMYDQNDNYIYN